MPDDILAYVRFDDDGERLTLVQQLASAQEDAENASDLEDEVKAARRGTGAGRSRGPKVPWAGLDSDKMESPRGWPRARSAPYWL